MTLGPDTLPVQVDDGELVLPDGLDVGRIAAAVADYLAMLEDPDATAAHTAVSPALSADPFESLELELDADRHTRHTQALRDATGALARGRLTVDEFDTALGAFATARRALADADGVGVSASTVKVVEAVHSLLCLPLAAQVWPPA